MVNTENLRQVGFALECDFRDGEARLVLQAAAEIERQQREIAELQESIKAIDAACKGRLEKLIRYEGAFDHIMEYESTMPTVIAEIVRKARGQEKLMARRGRRAKYTTKTLKVRISYHVSKN